MKVAISIPRRLLKAAEQLARQRRVSLSAVFRDALREYASRHGSSAVTERLNAVYATEGSTLEASLAHGQLLSLAREEW